MITMMATRVMTAVIDIDPSVRHGRPCPGHDELEIAAAEKNATSREIVS